MPPHSGEARSRIHIWLADDDIEWYKSRYGRNPGFSAALQKVIRNYRRQIEARAASDMPQVVQEQGEAL